MTTEKSCRRTAWCSRSVSRLDASRELGREAGVAGGRQREQALFRLGRNRQLLHEAGKLGALEPLAAAHALQLLVRLRHAMAAHDLLHRLRQYLPVRVEILRKPPGIGLQLAEAALAGAVREQG